MRTPIAWLLACLVASAAFVPLEKVSLRAAPQQGLVVHYQLAQQFRFDSAGDSPDGQPPTHIAWTAAFAVTQRTGFADAQGRIPAEHTYDRVEEQSTSHGDAGSLEKAAADDLLGKTIRLVFAPDGSIVDTTAPPGAPQLLAHAKEIVSEMFQYLPEGKLGVGESVSVPISVAPPVRLEGALPSAYAGHLTTRLKSIEYEDGDRIAVCEQTFDGAVAHTDDTPGPDPQVTLQLRMHGAGTLQINLDRGFVKSSTMETAIEAVMALDAPSDGKSTPSPRVVIRGLLKFALTGSS